MLTQVLPYVSFAALLFTIGLLFYHLGQLRRYFRLTQERIHLANDRMDGHHRRIIALEQERKAREAVNPWREIDG